VLSTVGAVECRTDGLYQVRESEIGRSERAHVRRALEWVSGPGRSFRVGLLLSAPAIAAEQTTVPFQRYFGDLRTAVRGLIASTRSHLLLASPFWDVGVANDITMLLERRLAAGVRVDVLARTPLRASESARALSVLAGIRVDGARCQIRILEERSDLDPFGKATFHFKVAVADGEQAYMGSANFNTAGMASRWELGVLLSGSLGRRVSQLVQSLFDSSRPMEMR
jgi:phosphatidylserine/phosphatidylglycerophosphate/cardiolipin synthase-like enzyme